jgi:transcriptional regulator with XRE-family HTH domain
MDRLRSALAPPTQRRDHLNTNSTTFSRIAGTTSVHRAPLSRGRRRLATIRKSRGFTQSALATALGKTRPAVGHWEAGRSFIRSGDLARVARALECRMRDLLAPVEASIPARPLWWPRRSSKYRRRPAPKSAPFSAQISKPAAPTSAEAERLRTLVLEVLQRLVRYEPEAIALIDQIVSDGGRADRPLLLGN